MQKHAVALGYFFLAVFSLHFSHEDDVPGFFPFLLAVSMTSWLVGFAFFFAASAPFIQSFATSTKEFIRKARQSSE